MKTFKDTPDIQRFSDGETIVSEGIISNNAYIILKGQVSVSKKIEKLLLAYKKQDEQTMKKATGFDLEKAMGKRNLLEKFGFSDDEDLELK